MQTIDTMTADDAQAETTQMAAKAEQQLNVMSHPTNADFEAANLVNAGKAGEELVREMEEGSSNNTYCIEEMYKVMSEIVNTEDYEQYIDLTNKNSSSPFKAVFRTRGKDGAEISFNNEKKEGEKVLRCSLKPSKGNRMTIDAFINGHVIRFRVTPVISKDSNSKGNIEGFTPEMLSLINYDSVSGQYKGSLPEFKKDFSFSSKLIVDFLKELNDKLKKPKKMLSAIKPSNLRKDVQLHQMVRGRTAGILGR